jgi:hypothetical protein
MFGAYQPEYSMGREESDSRGLDITDYEQFVEYPFRYPRQSGHSPEHLEDFDTANYYNRRLAEESFPDPGHPQEHLVEVSLADLYNKLKCMLHHVGNAGQAKVCIGSSQRRSAPTTREGSSKPPRIFSSLGEKSSSLGEKSQVSSCIFSCA